MSPAPTNSAEFILYQKPGCPQCTATSRRLKELEAEYRVLDMSVDDQALADVKQLGYLQAPVIVAPSGEHWSGYRPDKIDAELAALQPA